MKHSAAVQSYLRLPAKSWCMQDSFKHTGYVSIVRAHTVQGITERRRSRTSQAADSGCQSPLKHWKSAGHGGCLQP